MPAAENVSLFLAPMAGFISFFSPCILPLIPSYIAFISGISAEELTKRESAAKAQKKIILSSCLFILGFSLVFISLGASASFIGQFFSRNIRWFEIVGGIFVILMGLHFAGILRISFLDREKSIHLKKRPAGGFPAFLIGMAFASGWTPCVGPVLGSILALAATRQNVFQGVLLLAAYSLGLALPFFLASLAIHKFFEHFSSFRKYLKAITLAGGIILILVGILLLSGYFSSVSAFFAN